MSETKKGFPFSSVNGPGVEFDRAAPVAIGGPWPGLERLVVIAVSAFFLIVCLGSIRLASLTNDEVTYIPAGLSYLQRHDARMDLEHPPFMKVLAAIPLLPWHPKIDYNDSTWENDPGTIQGEMLFGKKFFESNPNQDTLVFLARLPMIGVTLLLGLSLYIMARRLAGPWGAVLTLVLFSTSPFFIAYGSLVLNDTQVALFSLWTMWYFASLWQKPTSSNALFLAASLTGALLAKFSSVFLFPAMLVSYTWFRLSAQDRTASVDLLRHEGFRRERLLACSTLLAAVVVYVCYLILFYRSDPLPILQNEALSIHGAEGPVLLSDHGLKFLSRHPAFSRTLLPLSLYWGGLVTVVGYGSRKMYFLGQWHPHGVWYYFPVISFFKLAPGMIFLFFLLVILAGVFFLRSRDKGISIVPCSYQFHLRAFVATLAVFAAVAMSSKLNIGVRHFSVPIACTTLLSALIIPLTRVVCKPKARSFVFGVTATLAVSCFVTALAAYPHYISYYNVFRLNVPKQEIAVNGNLSWGQSMKELSTFFSEQHVSAPYVDQGVSRLDPAVYIAGARSWQCDQPEKVAPEWLAVSANALIHEPPNCNVLLRYPSWTIADGTTVVFHITGSQHSRIESDTLSSNEMK